MHSTSLKSIAVSQIKRRSGFEVVSHHGIDHVRAGYFCRLDISVPGDAPKDFLRIYDYGRGRKVRMSDWPSYIAKVGHKLYPNESITEHLITRIGQLLGLEMARSRLMWVRGQLRFLSEYFLRPDESLIHGAEIFAGYLADKDFVDQVGEERMERDIFTFQVVEDSVLNRFPNHAGEIMRGFVRLLGFDAIIGNNDRHHFNWGVITQVAGKRSPRFSPIYDTARGLLWNTDEAGLASSEARIDQFLDRYVKQCYPMLGWDGAGKPNHFELIEKIVDHFPSYARDLMSLVKLDLLDRVEFLLHDEFKQLFSPRRKMFILKCLRKRADSYADVVTR
jgi:hypothetical protein